MSENEQKRSMIDPDKLYHKMENAGEDWVNFQADADLLEETKKILYSALTRRASAQGIKGVAASEHWARSHHEFKTHIDGMIEARRKANSAKVKYKSIQVYFDAWRTIEATRRAEMNQR